MRIEVGRSNTHRKCTFNLGAQFDLDLLRVDVLVLFPVMMEVSVFVQETRHFVGGSYRTPTVINSLTRHREMQSEVPAGMGFGVVSDLGEPRAGHHQARGVDRASLQRFNSRGIHGMSFTEVVGMNDDQLCAWSISQMVRQGLRRDS